MIECMAVMSILMIRKSFSNLPGRVDILDPSMCVLDR